MSDIRRLVLAAEIEEEDLGMEHMRVTDGWSMFKFYLSLNGFPEQTGLLEL
jgi:hypothetical protein